jgi:hypothetical protein
MQMLGYILIVVVFFAVSDLKPAIKAKRKGYVYIYIAMVTTVLVTWVLLSKGVEIPGPNEPIRAAIESIVGPLN